MADPIAAATGFAGFPSWVLLDTYATYGERRNHTTAHSLTSANRAIEVSFELVDPPKVSRWFVNRTGRTGRSKATLKRGFHGLPHILNSSGSFIVMQMGFYDGDGGQFRDYFVYNAGGPGKPPSLDLILGPCPTVNYPNLIAVLPSDDGDGGEHYSVIFPFTKNNPSAKNDIRVFSSADRSWSTKFARTDSRRTSYHVAWVHQPSKVIAVGRGSLAWIDPWQGVLLCDGLDGDKPVLRLIKWPGNDDDARHDGTILMSDSTIRFVETRFRYSRCSSCHSKGSAIPSGWTATMWKRRLCSSEERCDWEMCYEVDIAKILRACSLRLERHSTSSDLHLLRKVWDTESNRLDLNKMSIALPTLSLTNDDVVYFTTNLVSNEALVIAVNARKKKVEAVAETSCELNFSPCSFPNRLLGARSSSGTDDKAANQSNVCNEDMENVDCLVMNLQDALDELKDIEKHLELRKPLSSSSLHDAIEAVEPHFSVNVHDNNSKPDAADLLVECFRVLGDLKSRILAPVEEMKNKVSLALAALDTLQNGPLSNDGKSSDDSEDWPFTQTEDYFKYQASRTRMKTNLQQLEVA